MEFAKEMHCSNNIKNLKEIIKKLKKTQSMSDIYCICIEEKSNSIIEIIHSHELHKPIYQNKNYIVIGISNTKNEAKEMICAIILEIYKKDNELSALKEMLLQSFYKERESE